MDRRSWLALVAIAAIWGASYLFIKIGLRDLSPAMVAWIRVVLGAAVLLPIAWRVGALAGVGRHGVMVALVAAIQVAAPFLLIARGEQEISSALAGILVSSVPIFTAIIALAFDPAERPSGGQLAGIGVGMAGVGLLLGVDLSGSEDAVVGGLLVVLASLGYAIGGFVIKHRLSGVRSIGLAAIVLGASAVLLAPVALASAPESLPGVGPVAAVGALGIVGTGIAFAIFYWLIAGVGPSRAVLVTYLAPVFAVAYGAVLLDERIGVAAIAGLALIVGGSWAAARTWRPRAPQP